MNLDTQSAYQKIKIQISEIKPETVLVAVSKKQSVEKIISLYKKGQRDFGENYVQELTERAVKLKSEGYSGIRWHFMGHLQKNKVKQLLPHVFMIHSIDSLALAKEIEKKFKRLDLKTPIDSTIQINIDNENTKSGISLSELDAIYSEIKNFNSLHLQGIMCIPKIGNSELAFQKMKNLANQMKEKHGEVKLSMGMSDDYESALRFGSDYLRLGRVLFGERRNS